MELKTNAYKSIEMDNQEGARDMDVENHAQLNNAPIIKSPRTLAEQLQENHSAKKIILFQRQDSERRKKVSVLNSLQTYQKDVLKNSR